MNLLDQLKTYTKVLADTGDSASIKQYKPVDTTTNSSLIFAASTDPNYRSLIDDALHYAKQTTHNKKNRWRLHWIVNRQF